jgi:hypothetical protein
VTSRIHGVFHAKKEEQVRHANLAPAVNIEGAVTMLDIALLVQVGGRKKQQKAVPVTVVCRANTTIKPIKPTVKNV